MQGVTGSSPVSSTIKITTPAGCGYFYGNRGNLKCSGEMNSPSAKVSPAAKRLYGANAPPRCAGPDQRPHLSRQCQARKEPHPSVRLFLVPAGNRKPAHPGRLFSPREPSLCMFWRSQGHSLPPPAASRRHTAAKSPPAGISLPGGFCSGSAWGVTANTPRRSPCGSRGCWPPP